jgi:Domain of unknown function (DUF5069)
MKVENLRSSHATVGGIVYFPRMLDKIRLRAAGELPSEYHANLGGGFDDYCCKFLWIDYAALVERAKTGGTDDELLQWAFQQGRQPDAHEIMIWNAFMKKRGWNDEASEHLAMRKRESHFEDRDEIQTFFDYIDADEEREIAGVQPA